MGRQARTMGGFAAGLARRQVPARGPGRLVAIGVVTVFGILAGSAVGAALYRTVLQEPAATAMSMLEVAPAAIAAENEKPAARIAAKPDAEPNDLATASVVGDAASSTQNGGKPQGGIANSASAAVTASSVERAADARFVRRETDTRAPSVHVSPARFKTAFAQPILAGTLTDSGETVDAARTGSIIPPSAIVEFAETESEIIEMESKLTALGAEHFKVPQQSSVVPVPAPPVAATALPEPGLVNAKTRKWVNMRSAPNNKARVLAVVPAQADIFADENCTRWCGVVYEGRKGFIYRTFITRAERSSKPVKVASVATDDDGAFKASSVSAYAVANAEAENMGFKKGCARKWVNLRAGPSSKSEVLTIVPADAEIMVETDCKWCGVVYKGQKGYIYKSFVMYEDENNG
ncbi:SH3 domain-containing protein [Hoeflea prorocentri]|uniref:SH3 domain-containing protein n=1 Tax=Hoeflea prorocentri TaxID=1922333 RepID=A0A9X3UMH7_9HYPH|nr:SH3 domain-containing protein [Hoeflea prorocentri]MCY6383392.1 SH3 domain-containing protein [Hoeflea prorocentri]MDA5401192.1 SH3 domain-containing protein [Hoeflea prorocentri]